MLKRNLCIDCSSSNPKMPTGAKGEDGTDGVNGATGATGADGTGIGFTVTDLDPGEGGCDCGGYQIEMGPDADGDGVPDSVTETLILCSGCDGNDYEFPFSPILMVYDDPTDAAKFDQAGGDKGLGLGIYAGWAICNGNNGTQDLRGKFPVAYSDSDADYSTVGNNGGSKTVTLSKANLPKHQHVLGNSTDNSSQSTGNHTHSYTNQPNQADIGSGGSSATRNNVDTSQTTGGTGAHVHTGNTGDGTTDGLAGSAHENRPPYFTLIFIQKI